MDLNIMDGLSLTESKDTPFLGEITDLKSRKKSQFLSTDRYTNVLTSDWRKARNTKGKSTLQLKMASHEPSNQN
jgi:ribosomal protein L32E